MEGVGTLSLAILGDDTFRVADDPPGIGGYCRSLFDWHKALHLGKDGALVR